MIEFSPKIDLGQDRTRIKDPRDADRQTQTAQALLSRFVAARTEDRWPLQLLADEVGMGKTFVSLAVAFSMLEHIETHEDSDFDNCYYKVVILAPPNRALLGKWTREVGEFVGRCIKSEHKDEERKAFKAEYCERLDDFAKAARRPGKHVARVLIAPINLFQGQRITNLSLKQRFVMAALFRHWGNSFQMERRARLLKHARNDWPSQPERLGLFTDDEWDELPCDSTVAQAAIKRIDRDERRANGVSSLDKLLESCREVTEDYARGRETAILKLESRLTDVYRAILMSLVGGSFPLVIIDEAHHWKNGPSSDSNGYAGFREHLASRARRILLLTATPFQLRPREMLELMRIGLDAQMCRTKEAREAMHTNYGAHITKVIEPTLELVDQQSRRFAKAWSAQRQANSPALAAAWDSEPLVSCRSRLEAMASATGRLTPADVDPAAETALENADPGLRGFLREALRLFAYNRELTHELGRVVIRHRRKVEHRQFRIGEDFPLETAELPPRPDRHSMHAVAGLDVRGEGELPHYLLMRCVADMKGAGRKTSLGTAITGCYSTLFESAEGKQLEAFARKNPAAEQRYKVLKSLVGKSQDHKHPKLAAVVDSVVRSWEAGEKSLIFCFRTNTAERLFDILHDRIEKLLSTHRSRCLGSEETFHRFRGRLMRRDDSLITTVLDRPLWSLAITHPRCFEGLDLSVLDEDLPILAKALANYGFDSEDKADRLLVHRAVEHVVALRIRRKVGTEVRNAITEMADVKWIEFPYGIDPDSLRQDKSTNEDLRGVDQVYQLQTPSRERVASIEQALRARRVRRDQSSTIDIAADGPSLWFGGAPASIPADLAERVIAFHGHLTKLSIRDGKMDWGGRRKVFEALRRIVSRDAMLIRLLPSKAEREDNDWATLLAANFWLRQPEGQKETMAHRVDVFLEGLTSESGDFEDRTSARAVSLDATRLGHDRYVALIKGGSQDERERVFGGFNSPLLPEILVCTSVGSEGIDLHRFCRHVIHYDLAWNPAVIEQRTGRIDRIGSKTFRERALASTTMLEVGVPYLAGTYDERMFEELRMRAQVFEVITGGDMAPDEVGGSDDAANAEGEAQSLQFPTLPQVMVEDLRVRLNVWDA